MTERHSGRKESTRAVGTQARWTRRINCARRVEGQKDRKLMDEQISWLWEDKRSAAGKMDPALAPPLLCHRFNEIYRRRRALERRRQERWQFWEQRWREWLLLLLLLPPPLPPETCGGRGHFFFFFFFTNDHFQSLWWFLGAFSSFFPPCHLCSRTRI